MAEYTWISHPKPSTLCAAIFDLDDDIHLVGVGTGASQAALFGGVADKLNELFPFL